MLIVWFRVDAETCATSVPADSAATAGSGVLGERIRADVVAASAGQSLPRARVHPRSGRQFAAQSRRPQVRTAFAAADHRRVHP